MGEIDIMGESRAGEWEDHLLRMIQLALKMMWILVLVVQLVADHFIMAQLTMRCTHVLDKLRQLLKRRFLSRPLSRPNTTHHHHTSPPHVTKSLNPNSLNPEP